MKVKVKSTATILTNYLDEKSKKALEQSGIYQVTYHKEKIIDINEEEIIRYRFGERNKAEGFGIANNVYDICEKEYKNTEPFTVSTYEIIEDGYASDIPYIANGFDTVEEFKEYMMSDECKMEVGDIE